MGGRETRSAFSQAALPSAHTAEPFGRGWIEKEAAHQRQLALAREGREAEPGRVARARRKAGYLLIRSGVWLGAVSFPPARKEPSPAAERCVTRM
jgi:hypothetical protein